LEPKPTARPPSSFPIVGIGASAGGLDAFAKFFEGMPPDSGMAFVLIQHLDPTKKSLAAELLARSTPMQVAQVEGDLPIQPNHVYVIPPDRYLGISGGTLHLSKPDRPRGARMAVDFFLRSLARDQEQRAIGVILSGTGTDGTLGIKAIKAAGGLVIAQDPATAEYDGMPRSAIANGTVDYILPPDKIPAALVRYAEHPYVRERPTVVPEAGETTSDGLRAIIALVRSRTKHDFRSYKDTTLARRTRRRMCLYRIEDYPAYLKYLRAHPEEIDLLAKDLLITVTDFFRDPEAWEALRRLAIRPMVERKGADESIRIWTPGCATGEEPYSLLMLVLEELRRTEKNCRLQMFASDIDIDALNYARAGRYPKSIEADVSQERLTRFFSAADHDDYFQVSKNLRDGIVFAEQDLIGDPPFSRLDLICCRNVLIYLKPEIQEKVIALFHFALREGGVLFLGGAETLGRQTDLFDTLDKKWRIFRRVGLTRYDRVNIPLVTREGRSAVGGASSLPLQRETRLMHLAQQRLLDLLAPDAVLIDRRWHVLYICGDVDPYLMHRAGIPTDNLLDKVRSGLRSKLRDAVQTALAEGRAVSVATKVRRESAYSPVRIVVRLIRDRELEEDLALIVFESGGEAPGRPSPEGTSAEPSPTGRAGGAGPDLDEGAAVRQLEQELRDARDDLQSTIEQLEASNEEYRAAHEEVVSTNEELQSTNEELETSKEELQSLNEELATVNSQLAAKVDELENKHVDLENLIAVTDLPTICLDTSMALRWFTPAAQRVIRLKVGDNGRPLADLSHDFTGDDLVDVSRRVLARLTPVEDEVTAHDGRTFLRRVTPFRGAAHRMDGIVITFVDITRRKSDEQALRSSEQRLANELAAMENLHELVGRLLRCSELPDALEEVLNAAVTMLGADRGNVQLVNPSTGALEIVVQRGFQRPFLDHFRSVSIDGDAVCGQALKTRRRVVVADIASSDVSATFRSTAAEAGYRAVQSTPLVSPDGAVLGMLSTHWREPHRPSDRDLRILDLYARQAADFIARHRAEEALHHVNEELQRQVAEQTQDARSLATLVQSAHDAISVRTLDGTIVSWNPGAERLYGYGAADAIGKGYLTLVPPDRRPELEEIHQRLLRGEAIAPFETYRFRKDGTTVAVSIANSPIKDATGQVIGIASIGRDITERKAAEEQKHQHASELAHVLRVATIGELASGLAHELNQPLTAISNNLHAGLHLLETESGQDARLAEVLRQAAEQVQHAGQVVHSIRDMVERRTPHRERFDLGEPIHRAVALLDGEIDRRGITLRLEGFEKPIPVRGDVIQIEQVALNLLQNAMEALVETRGTPQCIEVSVSRADEGTVEVAVRDTGPGVPPAVQEHLFRAFFSTKTNGLGMGLALCQTIVEAHGGRLWFERGRRRGGATFRFTLPVASSVDGGEAEERPA
jgi:two-component system CheB/CheR fusion protein